MSDIDEESCEGTSAQADADSGQSKSQSGTNLLQSQRQQRGEVSDLTESTRRQGQLKLKLKVISDPEIEEGQGKRTCKRKHWEVQEFETIREYEKSLADSDIGETDWTVENKRLVRKSSK